MSSDEDKSSPWVLRRARIARQIELVTMELCLKRGIDALTVEDAAAAAGISRSTFYRYFDTIDDVLCAWPRRSLEQICERVRKRPPSEDLIDVFANGITDDEIDDDERRIRTMGAQISELYPVAWWRAMGRLQPSAYDQFLELAEERLSLMGQDPADAPLVSSVLVAVAQHVARHAIVDGAFAPSPGEFGDALRRVGKIFELASANDC